jgi:hypothetical protein
MMALGRATPGSSAIAEYPVVRVAAKGFPWPDERAKDDRQEATLVFINDGFQARLAWHEANNFVPSTH